MVQKGVTVAQVDTSYSSKIKCQILTASAEYQSSFFTKPSARFCHCIFEKLAIAAIPATVWRILSTTDPPSSLGLTFRSIMAADTTLPSLVIIKLLVADSS